MSKHRYELALRTILVSWRGPMKQVREGDLGDSRQLVEAMARRALAAIDLLVLDVEGTPYAPDLRPAIRAARAEIYGAMDGVAADPGAEDRLA